MARSLGTAPHVRSVTRFARIVPLLVLLASATTAAAQSNSGCGSLDNAYGPYDYRKSKDKLGIVERHHFTSIVEALMKGESGKLGGDLDYTLRAFPNHHRALIAVMRYGEKTATPQPADLPRPVECYFERAVRFSGEDGVVRLLYAKFLLSQARREDANAHLETAVRLAGDNGLSHYNVGLVYLEAKDYPRALAQAHKAIALGYTASGLKERLQAAGQWSEPPEQAPPAASSAPSS
jgi:tetratricopeptide (TPR) repeat protein